jgi:hypothetical protein
MTTSIRRGDAVDRANPNRRRACRQGWEGYVLLAGVGSILSGIPSAVESTSWTNLVDPYNTPLAIASLSVQAVLLRVGTILLLRMWRRIGVLWRMTSVGLLAVAAIWLVVVIGLPTLYNGWPECTG